MTELYPEIEPYARGMLDLGDGNLVYWVRKIDCTKVSGMSSLKRSDIELTKVRHGRFQVSGTDRR